MTWNYDKNNINNNKCYNLIEKFLISTKIYLKIIYNILKTYGYTNIL